MCTHTSCSRGQGKIFVSSSMKCFQWQYFLSWINLKVISSHVHTLYITVSSNEHIHFWNELRQRGYKSTLAMQNHGF